MSTSPVPIETSQLRASFDSQKPLTVGLEEEVMLLDTDSLELVPRAREVAAAVAGDERFKLELPACQIEIVTPPSGTVAEAVRVLAAGREELAGRVDDRTSLACAGAHPFSAAEGDLIAEQPARAEVLREYGVVARRQLICALQVHVAIGEADATIAVHDAARSYLPELAALAANAPFRDGRDIGLASVRPKIAESLPRQGIPPALGTLERLADALSFGQRTGAFADPGRWWWELRPNVRVGTLELRVPDAQARIDDVAAVAAVAHCLLAWLLERHRSGEVLPVHDRWRIEENRWRACRHGVGGELIDLDSGTTCPTSERLEGLLAQLEPVAESLACAAELRLAGELIRAGGGAGRLRRAGGAVAATRQLVVDFGARSRLVSAPRG